MASKKTAAKTTAKKTTSSKTTTKKKTKAPTTKLQFKQNAIADLKQRVQGKDGTTKLLDFSDEAVIGHVAGVIPSGNLEIDRATGIGGWPMGRIVELAGEESSGKTTTIAAAIASCQRRGGVAMLLDAESKFDLKYAASIGVNVDELQMIESETTTVESGLMAIDRALNLWIEKGFHTAGVPLLIAWDSVGASPAMAELDAFDKIDGATEAAFDKAMKGRLQPGTQARALSQMLRVITQKIAKAKCCFLAINQFYEKIGSFGKRPGMVSKVTKGGRGLKYHATMRVELIRTERLKTGAGLPIGITGFMRFQKNHLSMPRDSGVYAIVSPPYGRGLDDTWTIYESLKAAKYITSSQGWSAFNYAGLPEPVRWQGGFLGLKEVFAVEGTGAALKEAMLSIFHAYNPDAAAAEEAEATGEEAEEEEA